MFLLLLPLCAPAPAVERITLLALSRDQAILQVDGVRRVLRKGQLSPEGVKLVEADTEKAVIEIDGRLEELKYGVVIAPAFEPPGSASVMLWAGSDGFFHAEGSVNGTAVTFLVDTGANTVALNSALAKRIGLDYKKGKPGLGTTASGVVKVYGVKLNTVKVGEITLHNVDAGVIEGAEPRTPLLGMSFLGGLEMKRDGGKMELIKKY